MNKTVVVDEAYRDRQTANQFNAAFRHCRIGKIKPKFTPVAPKYPLMPIPMKWPFGDTDWKQTYMAKCGCKFGSACGNVACPHGSIATC